ncbi:MAG: tetratricopeptide repeat protein [Pseudomonadota bacterium]
MKSMLLLFLIILSQSVFAAANTANLAEQIKQLQSQWAIANYQTSEDKTEAVFELLTRQAQQVLKDNPDKAEALIWNAIIVSSDAGKNGGLSALGKVKQARDLLLQAEKINPTALNGSIYTSLGSLYYKVPGWPLGFGDDEQAEKYLKKALSLNPTGIDANYFYADYLFEQEKYKLSLEYFNKALAAQPRANRPVADAGRRNEIKKKLQQLEANI